MASTDDVVLRDQIKALRIQQQSMKEEKLKLEKSIESSELKCNALKMEANILAALDEVRFQEIEEPVESKSINDDGGLFNRQFIEKNLKLELEILNSELRQALPKLEKEAIRNEDKRNKISEELQEHMKKIESLPIVSREELEAKEEELIEKKQLLHEQISKLHKDSAKERSNNLRTLTQLRVKVANADDEVSYEKDRARRFKLLLLEEQGKIEYLRQEHSRLRNELERYHDGKGWQTEAFIGNTASVDGSIHVSQLASVLNVWIPPRDEGTHRITAEKIEHALADLQLEHKADLSCVEFVSLCDYLS